MSDNLWFTVDGPEDAPVVVLAHPLGADRTVWAPQVPALVDRFRLVRYDLRGHGSSAVPPGPYRVADLAGDVIALLDRLGVQWAHVVGLSLGGAIGLWLAVHAPDRVNRMALLCTSAWFGPSHAWYERAALVRARGTGTIADTALQRWFTRAFAAREPQTVAGARAVLAATPAEGYAACCVAIAEADLRGDLAKVTAPTLVVAGAADPATPPEHGEEIATGIANSRFEVLPDAAHLANVERAADVNRLLLRHLSP